MRIRPFLSSTALATALLTLGFAAPDAFAQKAAMLNPASGWAVTRIANAAGGGDYCALARKFERETVVTIARNMQNEVSLAIDFQRPRLDSAKAMAVTLDPGAGQQRVYQVTPVSGSAFVVRMGQDAPFFSALEKTGYLRVEAGAQSFSFNINDIDAGQTKLDACVVALVAPAAGDEAPEMAAAGAGAQPSASVSYKQDVNGLRRQLQELKEENLRLTKLLEGGAPITPEPQAVAAATAMPDQSAALGARIAALESENEALRVDLAQVKNSNKLTTIRPNPLNEVDGAAQSKAEALQAELERLKTENAKLQQIAEASGADGGAMAGLAAENRRLQEQIDQAGGGDMAVRVAELENQNAELKASLASAAAAGGSPGAGEQALAALKAENEKLKQSIAQQETAQAMAADTAAQMAALEAKNAELAQQLAAVNAQQGDTGALEKRIASYEAENKNLKSTLEKKGVDADLLEQLRQQIGQMQNENRLLQETAAKAQADFEAQKRAEITALKSQLEAQQAHDGSKEAAALEAKVASLEAANTALKEEVTRAATEAAKATAAGAQEEALSAELETLRAENESLKSQVAEAASGSGETAQQLKAALAENEALKAQAGAVMAQEEKIAALTAENESLKTAAAETSKNAEALAAAESAAEGLRGENAKLAQELAELKAAEPPQDLQTELAALQAESAERAKALEEALADVKALEAQIAEKDTTLAGLEALKAQMAEKDAALAALEEEKNVLVAAAQTAPNMETEVATLRAENAERAKALEDALADMKALEAQIAEKEATLAGLEALKLQLVEKDTTLAALEEEKNALVAAAQAVPEPMPAEPAEIAALNTQIESLQTENQDLLLRVAELETAAPPPTTPGTDIAALESRISALETDNAGLKAKLDQAQKDLAAAAEVTPEAQQRLAELERQLNQAQQETAAPVPAPQAVAAAEPVSKPQEQTVAAEPVPEAVKTAALMPPTPKIKPAAPQKAQTPAPLIEEQTPVAKAEPMPDVAPAPQAQEIAAAPEVVAETPQGPGVPGAEILDGARYTPAQAMEARMMREIEEQHVIAAQEPESSEAPVAEAEAAAPLEEAFEAMENEAQRAPVEQAALAPSAPPQDEAAITGMAPPSQAPKAKASGVQGILSSAGLLQGAGFERVASASGPEKSVYQWRNAGIYGSAEEQALADASQFDVRVKDYLERTQQRCQGDFAIAPTDTRQNGPTRIDSYDIACVGAGVDSSASLVFYNDGGNFTAVAHEAPTGNMDDAMNMRDQLVRSISGTAYEEASMKFSRKDG